MNIHSNGFWQGEEAKSHHFHDTNLATALCEFFKTVAGTSNISVADFGCGMGDYVKTFREHGIDAHGFDGNPDTPNLTNNLCKVLDLSQPQHFKKQFDWIMSLEVGEHLPKQFEDIYFQNLHNNNSQGIVLSWALKGQGGVGHFNEQDNDYIKKKLSDLNYINDIDAEEKLRKSSTGNWFKNTIMVFKK